MNRKEIEIHSMSLTEGKFGKPDLNRVETGGHTFMVKDVRRRNFFLRWTLGLWLIQKEWKIYSRLKGLKGIPQPVKRIDRFAFAMEFIPGVPIERGKIIPPSFFSDLDQVLKAIHSRGVVHMDLRHKGNILVSEKGEPFLVDFNSSFSFREKGILRRFLFPLFQWVDVGGLLKLKERASPNLMTPGELGFLKRFNRLRKLWIFN
jgi:hypothetical protein